MTEDERNELLAQSRLADSFNQYKIMGAKLLEKGRITPEQYHNKVREYGLYTGAIDPNNKNIPESIDDNDGLKMGLEIGGAIAGSLLFGGARLAHPLGWLTYVGRQSLASGAGAGVANYFYNKTMSSAQYASDKQMEEALELGGDVAKFNAAFMGGLKVGGPLIKGVYQTAKGATMLAGKAAGTIPGVGAVGRFANKKVQGVVGYMNGKLAQQNIFANELMQTAAERGIVLTRSMTFSPTFRSLAEAFSRMPFVGTPLQEGYEKAMKSVANTLVDDVGKGLTIEQAAAKFSNRFKWDDTKKKYILSDKNGYDPDSVNLSAFVNLLKRADGYEANIQKQLDKMFGSYSPRTGRRTSPSGEASQALARNTFASLNNWWKTIEAQNARSRYPAEFRKLMADVKRHRAGEQMTPLQLRQLFEGMNKTERHLLNSIDGAYADDLYRQFGTARIALDEDIIRSVNANRSGRRFGADFTKYQNLRKEQIEFLRKADQTGMLSAANVVFRENDQAFIQGINTAMRDSLLLKAVGGPQKQYIDILRGAQNGEFVTLPGATFLAGRVAQGKSGSAGYEEVLEQLFVKGGRAEHANLKELIGTKNYAKLAQNEMDDLFDSTIIKYMNEGGAGRQEFLERIGAAGTAKEMKAAKDRMNLILDGWNDARKTQTMIVNGKKITMQPIKYKDLENYGLLLSFLPERPALNQFVQRSIALKMAGGINAGALTGFIGIGGTAAALGGPVAGLTTMFGLRLLAGIISKPAIHDDIANLLAKAPTNPEARAKVLEELEKNPRSAAFRNLINGMFERMSAAKDPALMKALRAMGAERLAEEERL